MKNNHILNIRQKERQKKWRTAIQAVVVALLTLALVKAVFLLNKHEDNALAMNNDQGFVALSYFGVSRGESSKYVSQQNLDKQLALLKKQGYETISQQQIIDFYKEGKLLPEKALYLSFEDGRTDSSIFAQKVLEKLNYKATMYTYANKMDTKDTKFLKPHHLKLMENSGYWELGSNGYRLTYINIFNDEGQSLGMIDENDMPNKMMIEYYNHYLMDFLRNEYMIPVETRIEMEKRITEDYRLMQEIYEEDFGQVPKSYAIMHANALYNNMDPLVENINDTHIKQLFSMHFNQEYTAFNDALADIYNLSRLQVSPYWPTNHLMMKIQQASRGDMQFAIGDEEQVSKWHVTNGAAEFLNNTVILTSQPSKEAKMTLQQKLPAKYRLAFDLNGHVVGEQAVVLQGDAGQSLRIMLKDNEMIVVEKQQGQKEQELMRQKLEEIEWSGEDYAFNKATVYSYDDTQRGSRIEEDEYPRTLKKRRHVEMIADDSGITLNVDDKQLIVIKSETDWLNTTVSFTAAQSKKETGHEQYADDIYDTVIENIKITDASNQVIYTNEYTKSAKVKYNLSTWFNNVIDFFIKTF